MSEEFPKLLLEMATESNKGHNRRTINFYTPKCDRDFMMACVLFATGPKYKNTNLSYFIMQALKYYISEGLMSFDRKKFKEAIVEVDKLNKTETPPDVTKLLNELYNKL